MFVAGVVKQKKSVTVVEQEKAVLPLLLDLGKKGNLASSGRRWRRRRRREGEGGAGEREKGRHRRGRARERRRREGERRRREGARDLGRECGEREGNQQSE